MASDNFILPLFFKDLTDSTISFSDEEFGAYVRLLIFQWSNKEIPKEINRIKRIAESAEKNWTLLSPKFTPTSTGLQNKKMELIRAERTDFYTRQSQNGSKGGNPNFKKGKENPYYKKDGKITQHNPKDNRVDNPKDKPLTTTITTTLSLPITSPLNSLSETDVPTVSKKPKTPKQPNPLFKKCVGFWLGEIHKGWLFTPAKGKALKQLIDKIKQSINQTGEEPTEEIIFTTFKVICKKLPEWFKDKDLDVINGKYNEIIEQIKNTNNGIAKPTGKESVFRS